MRKTGDKREREIDKIKWDKENKKDREKKPKKDPEAKRVVETQETKEETPEVDVEAENCKSWNLYLSSNSEHLNEKYAK